MLDKNLVQDVLSAALETGGDFAEVFVENSNSLAIKCGAGKIQEIDEGIVYGVGIRIFKGLFQTYAYTNIIDRDNLLKTARCAASAIKNNNEKQLINVVNLTNVDLENLHRVLRFPEQVKKEDKIDLLKQVSAATYDVNPLIYRVDIRYMDKKRQILVANSDGVWVEDTQCRTRLFANTIAQRGTRSESATHSLGGLKGFELYDALDIEKFAQENASKALIKLDSVDCPSGKMPVVIHNGFGGVIFHEACGHALEATAVAKGASVFNNMQGKKIASDIVSAVDDGTISNAWGSANIDDEGNKTERKQLIKNGILNSYMIDKFGSRRMNSRANGTGRRQNYKFIPTSRMSNTFIEPGKSSFDEIIASTEQGLFAKTMSGGSVNTATGDFNFSVDEGYIIEKGKIKQPVRGAKLIGNCADILMKIDMVGNNLDLACGMCGSISGSIPVTVGQPTIRVSEITVGGQK